MKIFNKSVMCKFFMLVTVVVASSFPIPGSAATIFESGTLGPTGISWQEALDGIVQGSGIDAVTFSGVRFELTQPVVTTQVGGHVFSPNGGAFFGAIVELDDENDFPNSGDLSTQDVLGNTRMIFPVLSDVVFGDLALQLDPGWYALVFGSGLFGSDGNGGMPLNNPDIGDPSYIAFQPGARWFNLIDLSDAIVFDNFRFIISGTIVPEPSTMATILITFIFSLSRQRTRSR